MKKLFILIAFVLCSAAIPTLNTNPTLITNLPSFIIESSGLEITQNDNNILFWTLEDSGSVPELYAFDEDGDLLHTLEVQSLSNRDWEELAMDEAGNLYIADIGDNSNNYDELYIHKINSQDLINSDEEFEVDPEHSITFVYETPPNETEDRLNAEALIAFTDSLYIFTKYHTDGDADPGKTSLYRLPTPSEATTDVLTAEFLGNFQTFDDIVNGEITSVDISPDLKKVALLSYTNIWIFYNFEGRDFLGGDVVSIALEPCKKREAICFLNNCELYITNEKTSSGSAPCFSSNTIYSSLSHINACEYLPTQVDLKVFLEGPFDSTTNLMNTDLALFSILPTNQPYNLPPYNYDGNESVSTFSEEMIDWVLVEVRSGTPSLIEKNTIVVETKAGILLSDGRIVDSQNQQPLSFENLEDGTDYYVVIRHRNHLDIMSRTPITYNNSYLSYDFTTNMTQALGIDQLKEISPTQFTMYAGDFTQDGVIQISDYNAWKTIPAIVNEYKATDANLDGIVQLSDYDVWLPNKAKIGVPEIGF